MKNTYGVCVAGLMVINMILYQGSIFSMQYNVKEKNLYKCMPTHTTYTVAHKQQYPLGIRIRIIRLYDFYIHTYILYIENLCVVSNKEKKIKEKKKKSEQTYKGRKHIFSQIAL